MTHLRPWDPPRAVAPSQVLPLTSRRVQVLHGVCRGLTNAQIGAELNVTEDTVKTHVRLIFAAAGTTSRAQLVAAVYSGRVRILEPVEPWRRAA